MIKKYNGSSWVSAPVKTWNGSSWVYADARAYDGTNWEWLNPIQYDADLSNGLVSYYNFENNADDQVGSNDGTVSGATYTSSGKIDGCYSFDGSNDLVDLSANSDIRLSTFTWSAWVKLDRISGSDMAIIHSGDESSNNCWEGYLLEFMTSTGLINFRSRNPGCGPNTTISSSAVSVDTWYHVVASRNNSTGAMKLYINGSLVDSDTTTYGHNDIYFAIGARRKTHLGTGWEAFFDGKIDEVGIWNRALSSTEVAKLYNYGSARYYS